MRAWACVLLALAVAAPAPADEPAAPSLEDRVRKLEDAGPAKPADGSPTRDTPAPGTRTAGPRPTINWTGQFQADAIWNAQTEANRQAFGDIPGGGAFRRARLGLFGEYHRTEYRVEADFALAGRPSLLDAYAGVRDLPAVGNLYAGHFFEPFLLDRVTRNRFVTFLERALPDQAFAPARNLGVMATDTYADKRGTWAVGLFRSDSDVFGDDPTDDRFGSAVTGRLTGLPVASADGRALLHLGAAYSVRNTRDGTVRFFSQPEVRLGAATPNVPAFADTGRFAADWYQLVGAEVAGVRGPVWGQAEGVLVPVATPGGVRTFHSWYAAAGWFLTGESRPYRRETGTFDRVIPLHDAVPADATAGFGPGAWELAVRVGQLDLDSGPVRGGRLTDLTTGVNWHLNPFLRLTANHVYARPVGRGAAHFWGLRVGYEF